MKNWREMAISPLKQVRNENFYLSLGDIISFSIIIKLNIVYYLCNLILRY